jgi:hypothetical protein
MKGDFLAGGRLDLPSPPPKSRGIGRVADTVWLETTTPPMLGKEVHKAE